MMTWCVDDSRVKRREPLLSERGNEPLQILSSDLGKIGLEMIFCLYFRL